MIFPTTIQPTHSTNRPLKFGALWLLLLSSPGGSSLIDYLDLAAKDCHSDESILCILLKNIHTETNCDWKFCVCRVSQAIGVLFSNLDSPQTS